MVLFVALPAAPLPAAEYPSQSGQYGPSAGYDPLLGRPSIARDRPFRQPPAPPAPPSRYDHSSPYGWGYQARDYRSGPYRPRNPAFERRPPLAPGHASPGEPAGTAQAQEPAARPPAITRDPIGDLDPQPERPAVRPAPRYREPSPRSFGSEYAPTEVEPSPGRPDHGTPAAGAPGPGYATRPTPEPGRPASSVLPFAPGDSARPPDEPEATGGPPRSGSPAPPPRYPPRTPGGPAGDRFRPPTAGVVAGDLSEDPAGGRLPAVRSAPPESAAAPSLRPYGPSAPAPSGINDARFRPPDLTGSE